MKLDFSRGLLKLPLVEAVQAFPMSGVAEGAGGLADEHVATFHAMEQPLHMSKHHHVVKVGDFEASAVNGHPQRGARHVPRHPQRPGRTLSIT